MSTTRREAVAKLAGRRRAPRDRTPPGKPSRLHVIGLAPRAVTLAWRGARDNRKVVAYEVFRNGKKIGKTKRRSYTDLRVRPSHSYRYAVRALDAAGNHGRLTRVLRVTTPALLPAGLGSAGGVPEIVAPPPSPLPPALTRAMVDRLFWRAGFGPTDAERDAWTGKPIADLVDFFVSQPRALAATSTPPLTQSNGPIDPLVSSEELVMEWLDHMQRAVNPFVERMTFFWHRHWAVSRNDGLPADVLLPYRDRLRRFADFGTYPDASFRQLALEMTTADGAMSVFLNGFQNTKYGPNENYAREFMELFTLGVTDAAGAANYSQQDVAQLARAFTGWRFNWDSMDPGYGQVTFAPNYFDNGSKTIFGQSGIWGADPSKGSGTQSAVDLVLAHPNHAPFLVRKLWREFIVTPIPAATLADLVATYTAGGALALRPLLRAILSHPLIFESLDEPNLVKPPVVYLVGAQRQLGAPMKWFWQYESLGLMEQVPYEPPNVAGWEGGLAWMNTNTAQARFDLILRLLYLKHRPSSSPTDGSGYPGSVPIADEPGETPQAAFDRAYAGAGSPWLSEAARQNILDLAATHVAGTATQRLQRQYALRALMLGGPDAQVM